MLMVSSGGIFRDDLLEPISLGNGGGEASFPGGVTERRDLFDVLEGVR
jgi:hypothetical protein